GLMDCIITSADLITWIESVENRVLLYEYLQLRAKAIAWYKEPAQAYFDGRRNVMLSSIEQPGASEVLAKFLEEEMATTKEALYDMPDKGHYLPNLFNPHDDSLGQDGCVDIDE
ncbi:Hypothetical protein SCF082_LOCUS48352, partial [Durusdinium trenchii]